MRRKKTLMLVVLVGSILSTSAQGLKSNSLSVTSWDTEIKQNGGFPKVAILKGVTLNGEHAGAFPGGVWHTRLLNTKQVPEGNLFVDLDNAGGFIFKTDGSYLIEAYAPNYAIGHNRIRLAKYNDVSKEWESRPHLLGQTSYVHTAGYAQGNAHLMTMLEAKAGDIYRVEHISTGTTNSGGKGVSSSSNIGDDVPPDVYTTVLLIRIGN